MHTCAVLVFKCQQQLSVLNCNLLRFVVLPLVLVTAVVEVHGSPAQIVGTSQCTSGVTAELIRKHQLLQRRRHNAASTAMVMHCFSIDLIVPTKHGLKSLVVLFCSCLQHAYTGSTSAAARLLNAYICTGHSYADACLPAFQWSQRQCSCWRRLHSSCHKSPHRRPCCTQHLVLPGL